MSADLSSWESRLGKFDNDSQVENLGHLSLVMTQVGSLGLIMTLKLGV